MEYDVETGVGAGRDSLLITLRITPEERALLREAVQHWKKIVEDTNDESQQARLLFLNRQNRHLHLKLILEIVEPLLVDPKQLEVSLPDP